jgi:hypothetical protein
VEAEEGAGQVSNREARNHLTGMEKVWREFVGGSWDGETMRLRRDRIMIEIPFSSTSEDVQEYRLDAESGEMVLQVAPD